MANRAFQMRQTLTALAVTITQMYSKNNLAINVITTMESSAEIFHFQVRVQLNMRSRRFL
jgi:hypothetical protein